MTKMNALVYANDYNLLFQLATALLERREEAKHEQMQSRALQDPDSFPPSPIADSDHQKPRPTFCLTSPLMIVLPIPPKPIFQLSETTKLAHRDFASRSLQRGKRENIVASGTNEDFDGNRASSQCHIHARTARQSKSASFSSRFILFIPFHPFVAAGGI
jgi:hypothetical protein